jgi:hypothetical protein
VTPNPYAPPKAEVADIVENRVAPNLWNPNAAASWSLLFSPAFGAFLHMKNWQALGEPAKAASSKAWVVVTLSVLVGFSVLAAFLPDNKGIDGLSRSVAFVLLLSWYYASGKPQAAFIKARFGKSYPRRGWLKPLLLALLALVGFVAVVVAVAMVAPMFSHEV